jgi:hypothetical protein
MGRINKLRNLSAVAGPISRKTNSPSNSSHEFHSKVAGIPTAMPGKDPKTIIRGQRGDGLHCGFPREDYTYPLEKTRPSFNDQNL